MENIIKTQIALKNEWRDITIKNGEELKNDFTKQITFSDVDSLMNIFKLFEKYGSCLTVSVNIVGLGWNNLSDNAFNIKLNYYEKGFSVWFIDPVTNYVVFILSDDDLKEIVTIYGGEPFSLTIDNYNCDNIDDDDKGGFDYLHHIKLGSTFNLYGGSFNYSRIIEIKKKRAEEEKNIYYF